MRGRGETGETGIFDVHHSSFFRASELQASPASPAIASPPSAHHPVSSNPDRAIS
ncbi:MAG: hypothetical protein SWY16_13575 [Cyanobacteriota bacterium]|nr:hypothetical protein [Cyanobacteriota bacterium]